MDGKRATPFGSYILIYRAPNTGGLEGGGVPAVDTQAKTTELEDVVNDIREARGEKLEDKKTDDGTKSTEKPDDKKPGDGKEPDPTDKKDEKTDDKKVDDSKKADEEPEFTDPKLKNQRDWNLRQAEKLANDRKAIEEARVKLEADQKALEDAKKGDSKKDDGDDKKPESTKSEAIDLKLKHYKDVPDEDISDPEDKVLFRGEASIRETIRGLAKDVEERDAVIMDLSKRLAAVEDKTQVTDRIADAELQNAARYCHDQGVEAATALKAEYGIDIAIPDLMGAAKLAIPGWISAGHLKEGDLPNAATLADMWKFVNREEVSKLQSGGKKADAKDEKDDPDKAPPLSKEKKTTGGKEAEPQNDLERVMADIREARATSGRA